MVKVIWTPQSKEDLQSIFNFISKDSSYFAEIQIERFILYAEVLETQPQIGRIVPEINSHYIRELIIGNYRVIYELISENEIFILTIHHGARLLHNNPAFIRNKIEIIPPKKRSNRKRRKNR